MNPHKLPQTTTIHQVSVEVVLKENIIEVAVVVVNAVLGIAGSLTNVEYAVGFPYRLIVLP